LALSTADPGDDGTGLSEPSGDGYARAVTSPADWSVASSGTLVNADANRVSRGVRRLGDGDAFRAVRLRPPAANLLAHGALAQAKVIGAGDSARFAPGDLEIHLN
jgi:hypothetical protein